MTNTEKDYDAAAEWAEHDMACPRTPAPRCAVTRRRTTDAPCSSARSVAGPPSTRTPHRANTPVPASGTPPPSR
jgi:hypothetical protein